VTEVRQYDATNMKYTKLAKTHSLASKMSETGEKCQCANYVTEVSYTVLVEA